MRKGMTHDNGRFSSLLDSWKQKGADRLKYTLALLHPMLFCNLKARNADSLLHYILDIYQELSVFRNKYMKNTCNLLL